MAQINPRPPSLPEVIHHAQQNGATLHVVLAARIQGARDTQYLLTPPEGAADVDDLAGRLRKAADSIRPLNDLVVEVPDYAVVLAERLEVTRNRLAGALGIHERPPLEMEADNLGRALGAVLCREYLEQRGA